MTSVMTQARLTKKQEKLLRLLERLARRSGLRVSYGHLRFAGLKLKGGLCSFRGQKWLVIDRRETFDDQLELFRVALSQIELPELDIPEELQGFFDQLPEHRPTMFSNSQATLLQRTC